MRFLMYAALLAAGIAVAFWLMQSRQDSRRRDHLSEGTAGHPGSPVALTAEDSFPVQRRSRARMLYGPEAGPGWLTLYSTQLVFTSQSGRVTAIERIDIHGVSTSLELPDRTVVRPALVVATAAETHYFEVDDPAVWATALL